jgi:hypothetical protein
MLPDYYEVLGVPRDADHDTIHGRFVLLSRLYHPDRNKDKTFAAQKIREVTEAYATLGDDTKRTKYNLRYPEAGRVKVGAPVKNPLVVVDDTQAPGRKASSGKKGALVVADDKPRNLIPQAPQKPPAVKSAPTPLPIISDPIRNTGGFGRFLKRIAIVAAVAAAAYLFGPSVWNRIQKYLDHKNDNVATAQQQTPQQPQEDGQIVAKEKGLSHVDYYYSELNHPTIEEKGGQGGQLYLNYTGISPDGGTYTRPILLKIWKDCNSDVNSPQDNFAKIADGQDKVFYCTAGSVPDQDPNITTGTRYRIHTSPAPNSKHSPKRPVAFNTSGSLLTSEKA